MGINNVITEEEQLAYEGLPVPFGVISVKQDRCLVLAVSDGFCRMFRTTRKEFSGAGREILEHYIHPDDLNRFRMSMEKACLDPEGDYTAVYRVWVSSGEGYRWISVKGRAVRQQDGSYLFYVCFSDVHDETELHREEAADKLRQKILLSDILSSTRTAIFWKDADRRFLGANRAFLDCYGFDDEGDIIGKNDEEMGWHTEPGKYKNDELRVLHEGISTCRVHGKCIIKGENRDIVASKSPLIVDGKIVGLVGSFEDVTNEIRQQSEIHRLNEELEEQLSDRDILMSISGVCIVKIRLKDYTLLEYNDAVCSVIGLSRDMYDKQYKGSMEKFFTGEFRSEFDNFKNAVTQALTDGKVRFAINMRLPARDGYVLIGGEASFTDYNSDTKQPESMYAVYRDISDIIEAQKKLELAEIEIQKTAILEMQISKMKLMIDGVPIGIGALRIIDGIPDHKMQLNRYFTERVDIVADKESSVDLDAFLNLLYADDRAQCREDFEKYINARESMTARQYRIRTVSGSFIWISVEGTIVHFSDNVEIAYFTFTNINEMKLAEAGLQESQSFYRKVVQAAKLSTWEYNINDHTLRMSDDVYTQKTISILALPDVIENVPESVSALISDEDRPAFLEMYRKVGQGQNASCEAWYMPANGREPRCERVTYIAVQNPDGTHDRAIGFSQNITAEKKVEERYQRELGYLRQTDENNLGAKGHYNLTGNIVLEYTTKNDSFFKISPGATYDEAFNAFVNMPYKEDEKADILDKLDRKNLIERYQQGQMQTSLVYHRAREGRLPLWISMNVHTYMSPETGDLEAFTYAYDVTGKMETDEIIGLIAQEEFDFIGLIYAETDEFEFIKKSRLENYARVRERVSYSKACDYVCRNYVGEDERDQYEMAVSVGNILDGLRANNDRYAATYHRTENGRVLCKQMDYVWLDRLANIILVVRSDVTASFERDQKQLARIEAAKLEADKANEAKSTFLSSMSHDLRTPLNGVLGFTGLALREQDPVKKQEYLQKIDSSGKLLLDLVNDTLELSRIESGKAVLEPEEVVPDNLVPDVVTALQPLAEIKGIHIISDCPDCNALPVWCDRQKVQKIALNLISNAIKYTPEGGKVWVSSELSNADAGGRKWVLCVTDNGIGMSREFMKRMFEPFTQEKRIESLKTPGTGLGLSIVKQYVDLMGGTIEVDSRIHQGTKWNVTIPVCEVPAGTIRKKEAEVAAQSLSGMRVLICEDNYMNTEIATMLLKEKDVKVESAENGKEGVEMFSASEEGYYDAVLMDIRMPLMDGHTATRKIRALNRTDAKSVLIIAMTADAFEEDIREDREAGMNGYVTKPIEPQKLFRALQGSRKEEHLSGRNQ